MCENKNGCKQKVNSKITLLKLNTLMKFNINVYASNKRKKLWRWEQKLKLDNVSLRHIDKI